MLNGHDVDRARSALAAIPADLPREEWVRVGMAAKAAGLLDDDFTSWSSAAGNYSGERDCRSVWQSFRGTGIGVGTLFQMAKEHGWQDPDRTPRRERSRPAPQRAKSTASVADLWNRCKAAGPTHPYLVAKRGNPADLRQVPAGSGLRIAGHDVDGWLVLPAATLGGELQTLQFIPPPGAGKKLNLPGASFGDGLHVVGNLADAAQVFIVEGIGQAWACWQATGQPAIVTFGAGRTETVAQALRKVFPQLPLVLVPDRGKEDAADAIARRLGARIARMPADAAANFDANDYAAEHGADALELLLAKAAPVAGRYRLSTADDLAQLPPMRWLVRGVLPAQGLGAVYGPPGCGKTFIALDLAAAVAEGARWFGYTVKSTSVVYVGLEGEGGLAQRVQAWSKHHHRKLPDRLQFVIAQPFDLLEPDDLVELAEAIQAACGPGALIVIDTLNRAAPGADENDSADMGRIIDGAKRLQALLDGLVLLVHHSGKDTSRGMRGHSSLIAAIDAAIEVRHESGCREWRIAKAKDAPDAEVIGFQLEPVVLGLDDDGLPVTSCVVLPAERGDGFQKVLPPKAGNQRVAWDALVELVDKNGNAGAPGAPPGKKAVEVADAIDTIRGRLVDVEPKRQTERAKLTLTGLQAKGLIRVEEGWTWLI